MIHLILFISLAAGGVARAAEPATSCASLDIAQCLNAVNAALSQGAAEKNRPLFLSACEVPIGLACGSAAALDAKGAGAGAERSDAKAAQLAAKGCRLKDRRSCEILGVLHLNGQGVEASGKKALANFGLACDLGEGDACFSLGQIRASGAGSGSGSARAYFRKACALKVVAGCEKAKD